MYYLCVSPVFLMSFVGRGLGTDRFLFQALRCLRAKIKDLENGIPWIALSIGTSVGTKSHLVV